MVVKEAAVISLHRLHFEDSDGRDIYQSVISTSMSGIFYYIKKMEKKSWMLLDHYDIIIFHHFVWLTKYIVYYRERNFKLRRYEYCVSDKILTFDQILQSNLESCI